MKTPGIGRNDPCPCGSGKKFKHCCLGKENSTASSHSPASMSEALRRALEGRQFNSLEEAQAFLDQITQQQNRRQMDEFHGLSPEQMHQMLNFTFTSPELVRFPDMLDANPVAPVLALFKLLMDAIGDQGLKPTAKGNLPRNFCREAALAYWGKQRYQENTRFGGINREEDFDDLQVTRLVAELAGLIRKHKGRFILSRDCRRLLAGDGMSAIYPGLFRAYVEQFNWAYRDGYPELRFMQSAFLGAFPMLLDEVPPSQVFSPEETVRRGYTRRSLVNLAGFLGLATVKPASDGPLCYEYRVKSLPLLGQVVQFHLPK
ncbi:MAG: hypothetical protein B7Z66_13900 [Chromatiales bacterium 21-64-14]|nr:MAG: hypothetical protein B7Z66_13900 [Chromatiales bacterium 21-64-14]HQU15021.1 SEC-C metal-binding domain-containing protein [Gammaproteobacteria bacterium]